MTESVEIKKSKDRSPAFPFIPLERALERARQFYDEEKRGIAPFTRAVLHWRYSESSSGALQTVAALKSYGLLDEPGGSGKGRQLQLSDLALRILLDQRPDSPDRMNLIRQAARSPAVAAEVYLKWPQLPSDSTINHFLVLDKKFNESTALMVIKILKENQSFAKLHDVGVVSSSDMTEADEMIGVQEGIHPSNKVDATPPAQRNLPAAGKPKTAYLEQLVLSDGQTTVTLSFSNTATAEMYEELADFAEYKVAVLRKRALAATSSSTPDAAAPAAS